MDARETTLRSMMRPYESPQHSVVAFHARSGAVTYLNSGAHVCDAPCEDWMFEIASITKVFTAILLCVLVEEGKIDPHAPLRDMSGALRDVPAWITPARLASHTSGLPHYFMPLWKALLRQEPDGPYATFSRSDLLAWIRHNGGRPGPNQNRHAYSNLGVSLLGEAMAIMEDTTFADLLAEKVTVPMGLNDTTDHLNSDQQSRFAEPKTPSGKPTPAWQFQSLAAAGCLRSSAQDLGRFANTVIRAINAPETALHRAIRRSAQPILGLGPKGSMTPTAQCSGWLKVMHDKNAPSYLFHNGGTAGSSCALFISPDTNAAFAILSNNGIAGHLWGSLKLNWSNPMRQAHDVFSRG